MAVTWRQFAFAYKVASKTIAAWSKTIGATGDYATWAAMIAAMPDLIAHAVTVTIQAGTTLTETCELKNKHGITVDGEITIQAEKYFPTSGVIPTADSATATTLRDAALATAALGDDYFNGCWVFIVDGTGMDNGFVPITDYVDATGDVVVASWPGTQPDNTSRYLIAGALIDGEVSRSNCTSIENNTARITFIGVGHKEATGTGVICQYGNYIHFAYCGFYSLPLSGLRTGSLLVAYITQCGFVGCNANNNSGHGGIRISNTVSATIGNCGISDNRQRGVLITKGSFVAVSGNFGGGNGTWGTYAQTSGQADISGTECSGTSGNHSDPGTAGNANADQAASY